jgi:ABC-2 type transport system permease protein
MNEQIPTLQTTDQLKAIAWLRWRLFVNGLRTTRGAMELTSQILISFAIAVAGFGGAFDMCMASYFLLTEGKLALLALPLWVIFAFWQAFPVMAAAFTNNPDSSDLLRFPLSYGSFFLVRLASGIFDLATVLGGLWSFGFLVGIAFVKPAPLPWALVVILAFAAFNLLFMQMVFAWMERWLAQRRTREVMGVLFVVLMLCVQLIGPLVSHYGRQPRPDIQRFVSIFAPVQAVLPPGLAADAITQGIYPQWSVAFSSFVLLCAFVLATGYFLHVRLLAQYRGENLNEVSVSSALPKDRSLHLGWNLPGFTSPVAAVFEKEIRYLLRSGPMLLTLIMPVFVLFIFRFGAMNAARHSGVFLNRAPNMAFPAAAAYTLLILTNLVYNSFGGDAGGIQLFYASPVTFREIVLAKNLTHAGILAIELLIAWIAVSVLYYPPKLDITIATLTGLLFAVPVNFSAGNLLSIYAPKKLDYMKFGRQRASQTTALISMGVQGFIIGVGAAVFWFARYYGSIWIAAVAFLILAAIAFTVYTRVLNRIDRLALQRRETLVAELCRA